LCFRQPASKDHQRAVSPPPGEVETKGSSLTYGARGEPATAEQPLDIETKSGCTLPYEDQRRTHHQNAATTEKVNKSLKTRNAPVSLQALGCHSFRVESAEFKKDEKLGYDYLYVQLWCGDIKTSDRFPNTEDMVWKLEEFLDSISCTVDGGSRRSLMLLIWATVSELCTMN
jgi:hypothetical protein